MPFVASLSGSHLLVTARLLIEINQAAFSQLCILSPVSFCICLLCWHWHSHFLLSDPSFSWSFLFFTMDVLWKQLHHWMSAGVFLFVNDSLSPFCLVLRQSQSAVSFPLPFGNTLIQFAIAINSFQKSFSVHLMPISNLYPLVSLWCSFCLIGFV